MRAHFEKTRRIPARGCRVLIYEDPITRQKLEGEATIVLVEYLDDEDPEFQGLVCFERGGDNYFRTFGKKDLLEEVLWVPRDVPNSEPGHYEPAPDDRGIPF